MFGVLLFSLVAAAGPDPRAVLAKVKEATGGAPWDRITSTHAKVVLEAGGIKGGAAAWEDVRTGAPGTRVRLKLRSGPAAREVTLTLRDLV